MSIANTRPLERQPTVLRGALAAFMGLGVLMSGAHAQAGYSAEEVKLPSAAKLCSTSQALLSPTGQVATTCSFGVKLDAFTAFFLSIGSGELAYAGVRTIDVERIGLWRSGGTVQTLTGGSGTYASASATAILPAGEVFGNATANIANGKGGAVYSLWRGTTRSKWVWPTAVATGGWQPVAHSPGGRAFLLSKGIGSSVMFATVINKSALILPPLPAACAGINFFGGAGAVSDDGKVAVVKNRYVDVIPGIRATEGDVCVWSADAWTTLPSLPAVDERADPATLTNASNSVSSRQHTIVGISTTGQVLALDGSDRQLPRLWRAGQWVAADQRVTGMGANGELLGGVWPFNAANKPGTAILVRDDLVVDLNALVKPPAGLVWRRAVRTNVNGQVLVTAGVPLTPASTSQPMTGQERLFVLTPR
jgi:hypothetical protein